MDLREKYNFVKILIVKQIGQFFTLVKKGAVRDRQTCMFFGGKSLENLPVSGNVQDR